MFGDPTFLLGREKRKEREGKAVRWERRKEGALKREITREE